MVQDIPHVTLVSDLKKLLSPVGYIVIPLVKCINNVVPLVCLRKSHIF